MNPNIVYTAIFLLKGHWRAFHDACQSKTNPPMSVIAAEVKAESDPTILLKVVEELNRAMAEQGIGSAKFVSENKNLRQLPKDGLSEVVVAKSFYRASLSARPVASENQADFVVGTRNSITLPRCC